MMNTPLFPKTALVSMALWTGLTSFSLAQATNFGEMEVNQSQLVAIARPYGQNKYDLLILYQIPGKQPCWQEKGNNPTTIEPLLLNFDFTGICERSTDSNGYSIRIDSQDYGLDYLLRIVERDGELVLVGTPRQTSTQAEILVGRTAGLTPGFLKINLEPGWRLTKRTYQGKVLSHIYLSGNSQAFSSPSTAAVATKSPQPDNAANTAILTFTAPSSLSPIPPTSSNSLPPRPTPAPASNSLAPLPPPPTPAPTSNSLPPLPPPPTADSAIVPPPPPNARRNLSDVLGSLNGTNPSPPPAKATKGFKVLARADSNQQQSQLRSLYPEAFRTSYQGRQFWQVGVFSTQENAAQALRSLTNVGLSGNIIPF